ncbi:hypothetical protein GN244_ATG09167 [Phytophthora infestans]|uniref:ARS-binding protein 1 N-terminal domain-containing protein n=1 Tax=Phytophthora infestans TaxID=4787 RepID=A0A833SRH3_PHYIN|nr:hypothetical protein GN244_ATG09167 [Phytophthora infestans]
MPRRTHLSVAQKAELRLYYRAHPGLTHEDIIRWAQVRFSVLLGRSTVGSILRAPQDTSLNPSAKRDVFLKWSENCINLCFTRPI